MPADLNRLTEGWLELESDPGLFTLLLEDFGVRGVQVEEVYDLQKSIEGPVYGFIFLFKWIEERRSRRKLTAEESFVEDEDTINSIFFAQQMVPNSCATHALLSVLLNCPKIFLGPTLMRLKEHTANMSPENKGYAIGNTPELARAHNSHAKPEPRHLHEKSHGITTGRTIETFHFVSYVPISGRLFELDGLKPYPIDHGPCSEEDWTEKFRRVMTDRLGTATGGEPYHDVRFNLMAVVPDRRIAYEQKLLTLKTNRQIVLEALQQLVKLTHPELTSDDHAVYIAAMNKQHSETLEDEEVAQELGSKSKDDHDSYPKLPPALDSHNYAKSPLMEGLKSGGKQPHYEDYSGSEYSDEDADTKKQLKTQSEAKETKTVIQDSVDIEIKVTDQSFKEPGLENSSQTSLAPLTINTSAELLKPLSIQTKFQPSPTLSACSTDTSSEVGSAFNSPVQAHYNFTQTSPNSTSGLRQSDRAVFEDAHDIKKFVVIRVTSGKDTDNEDSYVIGKCSNLTKETDKKLKADEPPKKKACIEDQHTIGGNKAQDNSDKGTKKCDESKNMDVEEDLNKNDPSKRLQLLEPHKFAPKDLLALLKTVETEITICESNLHDEVEKRKKYKIDDCRRTHNYDQFICTFLSMLAEQGKLADLVEQQLIVHKRQGVSVGRLHRTKKPEKRRRSRPKKRKKLKSFKHLMESQQIEILQAFHEVRIQYQEMV